MQVTAAGVDAEGPGGDSGGLPGGESERMVEKVGDGGERDGFGRRRRVEQRSVGGLKRVVGVLERKKRSREVTAEGVRLIGPVQTSGASRVTVEGVLRLVVVLENQFKRRAREGHGTCSLSRD